MASVSIITSCFNKASFVEETINSVLQQTLADWELIIVDDLSSDGSAEVIKKFTADNRIHLICNEENKGANYSRNLGIKLAKGQYVMFLDADDLLDKNCLAGRIEKAQKYSEANLWIFGMGVFYRKPGDDGRTWKPTSVEPLNDFLQHTLPWSILQPLWRKSFLNSLEGFDENFERMQDVDLHTRALLNPSVKYYQFPDIIDCYYRIDEQRKNFNAFEFLQRWVRSAKLYILKYDHLVKPHQRKYLSGTVVKIFNQVVINLKGGSINEEQFLILKKEFEQMERDLNWNKIQRSFWKLLAFYNRSLPRIPGVNRLITSAIIHLGYRPS